MYNDTNLKRASSQQKWARVIAAAPARIALRVKTELAAGLLADSEFRQIPTEDLMALALKRKRIYTSDRASAIAVLKGCI